MIRKLIHNWRIWWSPSYRGLEYGRLLTDSIIKGLNNPPELFKDIGKPVTIPPAGSAAQINSREAVTQAQAERIAQLEAVLAELVAEHWKTGGWGWFHYSSQACNYCCNTTEHVDDCPVLTARKLLAHD